MASLTALLDQIKRDPLQLIRHGTVFRVCRDLGYRWRQRELDPATTIGLFIQQVIQGNTPCTQVRHIAQKDFTASAWCQARKRLSLAVYQTLVQRFYDAASEKDATVSARWHGHRVFLVDGSGVSMPDTRQLQKEFGQPPGQKPGCGFPTAHVLFLFNANTGMLAEAIPACWKRGDLADVPALLKHLKGSDILLGDDSFGSYVVLALLLQQGKHGLFPAHHARIVDFRPHRPFAPEGEAVAGRPRSRWIRSLGRRDQLVEYFKPAQKPRWMTQEDFEALPASILVRELRRTIFRPHRPPQPLTMVTTLIDEREYPPEELTELRGRRWEVETDIGHLKTTMKMDVLRCKTPQGVRKELCIFALVYNLVRLLMMEASRRQKVPLQRISFADTLHWLRHVRAGDRLPRLIVNPERRGRSEPRVKKRRPKPYSYMAKPRAELRKTGEKRRRRN